MEYIVWHLDKNWLLPSGTKTFNRYQDAKRYAKELALKEQNIKVWIDAYELVKGEYKYLI